MRSGCTAVESCYSGSCFRFVRVGFRVQSLSTLVFSKAARWSRGVIWTPGSYLAKSKALLVAIIR